MRARSVLVVVGWVAAAAVACSLAIGVVTLLDDGLGTQAPPPKSEKEVERDLAGMPDVQPEDANPDGGATTPDQGASPDEGASGNEDASPGGGTPSEPAAPSKDVPKEAVRNDASGVVGARCAAGKPTISYAQPAQGYQYEGVDDDDDDGDGRVSVKFSSENRDTTFVVTCSGASAKIAVQASSDDDDDADDRGES